MSLQYMGDTLVQVGPEVPVLVGSLKSTADSFSTKQYVCTPTKVERGQMTDDTFIVMIAIIIRVVMGLN